MMHARTADHRRRRPERPARTVSERDLERAGRQFGRPYEFSPEPPFIHRVAPDPPKERTEMPAPVDEVYRLAVRKTGDIASDYYEEDENLRQRIAEDEQTLARSAGRDLSPLSQRLPSWLYAALMGAFGVSEACVNVVIFLVMAMSQASTYVASLMLACGLPLLAHYAGRSWKQIDGARSSRLVMATTIAAAVVIVSAIAVVRGAYVAVAMRGQLDAGLSPIVVAVVFWGLNLAIFAAAVVAAHAHAATDPQGEHLTAEVLAAQKRLACSREKLRGLRRRYRTRCEQCDAEFRALAAAFHRGNMRARRRVDPEPPIWPQHLPSVPIPPALLGGSDAPEPRGPAAGGRPSPSNKPPSSPAAARAARRRRRRSKTLAQMIAASALVVLLALCLAACGSSQASESAATQASPATSWVVLVDLSRSTLPERRDYVTALACVLGAIRAGDRLTVLSIERSSAQNAQYLYQGVFPRYQFTPSPAPESDNPLVLQQYQQREQERRRREEAQFGRAHDLRAELRQLRSRLSRRLLTYAVRGTDIFGALLLAGRELSASSGRRRLVLLSDGVVVDGETSFSRQPPTAGLMRRIAAAQQREQRLPDLRGAAVLVIGARFGDAASFAQLSRAWRLYVNRFAQGHLQSRFFMAHLSEGLFSAWLRSGEGS